MSGFFDIFKHNDSGRTEKEPVKTEKVETKSIDVTREFTEHRIEIEKRNGEARIIYASDYSDEGETLHIVDKQPTFVEHYRHGWSNLNIPDYYIPRINFKSQPPIIIPYTNANSIDITENEELVVVVEDVEIEVIYRRDDEDSEWEEAYRQFEKDPDRDYDSEITEWYKYEWESAN